MTSMGFGDQATLDRTAPTADGRPRLFDNVVDAVPVSKVAVLQLAALSASVWREQNRPHTPVCTLEHRS
jgi:hypothetical protein